MRSAVILTLTILSACRASQLVENEVSARDCRRLPSLAIKTAKLDAASAYMRNDRRLIAVRGYAIEVPGAVGSKLPHRVIEGTSDDVCPAENLAISDYAAIYNREIIRLMANR